MGGEGVGIKLGRFGGSDCTEREEEGGKDLLYSA